MVCLLLAKSLEMHYISVPYIGQYYIIIIIMVDIVYAFCF